jgi:repressor LexA
MTTKERFIEYLKIKGIGQTSFEESSGLSRGAISQKSGFSANSIEKIAIACPDLNLDWLITGSGEMLKSATPTSVSASSDNSISYRLVPLLNLDAVGGIHSPNVVLGDREYADQLIPFTDAQEGDVALTVSGESMSPTCPPGSRVLIRQIPQWREYFGYGNIFVLLLTDGRRILKEVQKYPEDSKNYILCKSHNDKYPEEELPKNMIASVWKVIKILNERGW